MMFRANLHLHPHPNSQSKFASVPPGAFPTFTSISSSGSDFARTITLTPETPIQPIGRSSRNASKGLVADRNNGFFESAVMSRAHAEVRLVLEPTRKIIIKDTKSMHGTFVNGLQLLEEETAELQQDTEVTFGCEVTRGEEVFPPKTFRCDIEWEDMTPPKTPNFGITEKGKSRGGYGVTTEDITYASGEDFDEDEDEEEDEEEDEDDEEEVGMSYLDLPPSDEDKASSSGESSPPSSATGSPTSQPIKPTYVGASTSKPSYFMDEDIPVSHERSTKDMSIEKDVERTIQLKKKINEMTSKKENNALETNSELSGMRTTGGQRVSIGSLMNKAADPTPHDEDEKDGNSGKSSTRKSLPEFDFYTYDLTLSDVEVEIIPKEKFQATAKSSRGSSESKSKEPIVIYDDDDDDDDDEEMFYGEDGMGDCIDIDDDAEQDEEAEEGQVSSDEEEEEEEEDEEEGEQNSKDFEMKEKGNNMFRDLMSAYGDAVNTHSQVESRPMSPPGVMSSKIPAAPLDSLLAPSPSKLSFRSPIDELTHAAVAAMQAPTPPPPSATLPPLSKIHHETIIKKTPSGASHIHWLGGNTTPTPKSSSFPPYSDIAQIGIGGMDHKKEYFEAREINSNRARDTRVNSIHTGRDELALVCPTAFRSTSKSPPPQPYIVDGMPWVHGSKSSEAPKEALGLFPNTLESEKPKPIATPLRADNGIIPSPPPTVSSQAKRLLEDAVSGSEKNKEAFETRFSGWWPQGEVNFEHEEEDAEVHWDDEIVNDEDGEYDEEEENEEQHKGSGAEEEDMDDSNLDLEFEEDYEDELECEFEEEQQDDDIRTDVSEYGSVSIRMDTTNDEPLYLSQRVFAVASSSVASSNNSHFGRTSASEAGKSDFTKSRGFSISNLVNENTVTPPRPQLAATGTFYPTRPLISLPCRVIHQSPGQLCAPNHITNISENPASQARKEKSMADLLNPSSPAAGSKRKHEEISTILPEETPEPKCTAPIKSFDPENMDETDDDLEPQEEDEAEEEDDQPTLEPPVNLTEDTKPLDNIPATTTNTAVQVSVVEIKTVGSGSEDNDEPVRKKAKTGNSGKQIVRFAATALAGAIVGGVGVFAALVATAPAP